MMEVDSYKVLPSDPNTPSPFSAGCKCHQPWGNYMGKKKKKHIIFEGLKNNSEYLDWLCIQKWWKRNENNRVESTWKAHLLHQHIAIYSWKMGKIFPEYITTSCPPSEDMDLNPPDLMRHVTTLNNRFSKVIFSRPFSADYPFFKKLTGLSSNTICPFGRRLYLTECQI